MSRNEAVERGLEQVPLLAGLTRRERAWLARRASVRRYGAGDVIVRQGDTSMSFYLVLSGKVRVVRHSAGDAVDIVEEGPGSFFGEMGVIDDLPRAATVMALTETECGLLAKWDSQRELAADPGIALSLISVLNARIRNLEDRLTRTGGA